MMDAAGANGASSKWRNGQYWDSNARGNPGDARWIRANKHANKGR